MDFRGLCVRWAFYVYLFDNSPKTLNRLLVILAFNRFDIAFAVTGHDGLDSGSDA